MTTKINLTELLADREAGTGGPWCCDEQNMIFGHDPEMPDDPWLVADASMGPGYSTDHSAPNARRIARLPALEAAYIEAVEALRVVAECGDPECAYLYDEEGVEGWRWTHPDGREWTEVGLHNETAPLHPLARKFLGDGE